MKKLSIIILLMYAFGFSACKKSSSAPSIVGKWTFTNISGTHTDNTSTTSGETTTYTFSAAINTLTSTTSIIGSTLQTISTLQVTSEIWTFNNDGTYIINETYTQGSTAVTSTTSGTWEYLSNTNTNNSFILSGSGSTVISDITNSGTYDFSISGSTLVLSNVDAQTTNSGTTSSDNIDVTFTKS